jgi:hypothetical protein
VQKCVKVSGFPSPSFSRCLAACQPKPISRVLSECTIELAHLALGSPRNVCASLRRSKRGNRAPPMALIPGFLAQRMLMTARACDEVSIDVSRNPFDPQTSEQSRSPTVSVTPKEWRRAVQCWLDWLNSARVAAASKRRCRKAPVHLGLRNASRSSTAVPLLAQCPIRRKTRCIRHGRTS